MLPYLKILRHLLLVLNESNILIRDLPHFIPIINRILSTIRKERLKCMLDRIGDENRAITG